MGRKGRQMASPTRYKGIYEASTSSHHGDSGDRKHRRYLSTGGVAGVTCFVVLAFLNSWWVLAVFTLDFEGTVRSRVANPLYLATVTTALALICRCLAYGIDRRSWKPIVASILLMTGLVIVCAMWWSGYLPWVAS